MSRLRDTQAATIATSAGGSVAGAVVDPKGGWARLRSHMASPAMLAAAAGLVVAYLAGRCSARRGERRQPRTSSVSRAATRWRRGAAPHAQ